MVAILEKSEHNTDFHPIVDFIEASPLSMQQTINELTALCTSLQRQHSKLLVKFQAQKVEINKLNARVKILEDNQGVIGARSADDAPIKGRRIDEEEDTKEMATVLTSIDAATVLAGGIDVPIGSDSIPTAGHHVVDIHTSSDAVPTTKSTEKTMDQKAEEGLLYDCDQKQLRVEDFIPTGSKEEVKRLKRKGFNLEQEKAKKQKTSKEVPDKEKSHEEIPEEIV
nr:hypothetical protein [Tanacetum cinerariifolium]